ncbi:MAG: hypothetical protein Q7K54_03275 [Candidatus Parcubacteria bacterium]|nr:hypothetical protein [Candidatus Parcubacteria bacterium]
MENKHYLICNAPICQDDPNPNYKDEVIWRPGEKVCLKGPYQAFQKKQIEINKLVAVGKFKNMDIPYTAYDLETKSI